MKNILFLLAFALITNGIFAQYCDINKAQNIATNTINERFSSVSKENLQYKITEAYTQTYNGNEVFHIFNLEPQGFVIVSANQSTIPVLAFSTESVFETEELNPAAMSWVNNYAKQIDYNIRNNVKPSDQSVKDWESLSKSADDFVAKSGIKAISPLLKTKWNQGRYFNTACPPDASGTDGHAVVGCVATALGQLMNYFRFPSTGTGYYGYEHPDYGWLEVNFAEQSYNYDQMPVLPTDYNDDIARLLYNIGVSVDMNYGPDGSGMNNHKGAYTLRTYFGYDSETTYFFRDSVAPEFDWIGTLVEHLDQNIPLYYAGWSDYVYVSGHAFILDGYSDDTHYHINWGWGGSSDGYFLIDDLTPGGSDFTLLHEVIAYAVPASAPQYCNELKEINSVEGIIEDGSGPMEYYLNDTECAWLINPSDSVNGISFEFLKLLADNDDYIIIFDGPTDTSPILQTIYGGDNPTVFESTSEKVLIKFITNSDSVNDGWLLKYNGIKPDYCSVTSTLTAASGTISDGSNSYQYQNNEFCNWTIQPTGAENILITFDEFDIEPINDWVKILNSSNQTAAVLSGSEIPEPILIIGNKATVSFRTFNTGRAGGFTLHYEINVTGKNTIHSKNISIFPNPTTNNLFVELPQLYSSVEISVFTYDGKLCKKINNTNNSSFELELAGLSAGIYVLEIKTTDFVERTKFIKE